MSRIRWYAVIRPDWSKVFHDRWDTVRLYIDQVSNVKFKGFNSESEANFWLDQHLSMKNMNKSVNGLRVSQPTRILPIKPGNIPSIDNKFESLDIYTDGSCLPGNRGGWAYISISTSNQTILGYKNSTLSSRGSAISSADGTLERSSRARRRRSDGTLVGGEVILKEKVTNNRAELMAILNAIRDHTAEGQRLNIYSDSQYSIKSLTIWSMKWKKNGWITSNNKPVENTDLIKSILSLIEQSNKCITFHHVKAHNGNHFNEMADSLAKQAASSLTVVVALSRKPQALPQLGRLALLPLLGPAQHMALSSGPTNPWFIILFQTFFFPSG